MGSDGVTVTKFLQLLMNLELYLELSYFLSQICIVGTVTKVPKFPSSSSESYYNCNQVPFQKQLPHPWRREKVSQI